MSYLVASDIVQMIEGRKILHHIDLCLEKGKIYSIIGPNGCGKSTLLKTLARQLQPVQGMVQLAGRSIYSLSQKEIAKQLAYLMQHTGRIDITVEQLVSYGRAPHKSLLQRLSAEDEAIIKWAMEQTKTTHLCRRSITTLSGGELQRVWIAMALSQKTAMLFLDEPTNHLDIAHQIDLLELIKRLNKELTMTIVMVLHDLNFAAAYSDEVIVLKDGIIYGSGAPEQVMVPQMFQDVFSIDVKVLFDEQDQSHFFKMKGRKR